MRRRNYTHTVPPELCGEAGIGLLVQPFLPASIIAVPTAVAIAAIPSSTKPPIINCTPSIFKHYRHTYLKASVCGVSTYPIILKITNTLPKNMYVAK